MFCSRTHHHYMYQYVQPHLEDFLEQLVAEGLADVYGGLERRGAHPRGLRGVAVQVELVSKL
jgi:hypothetical protein